MFLGKHSVDCLVSAITMNVVLILGSVREGRKTNRVALHLASLFEALDGVTVTLLDLAEYNLPVFSNRWAKEPDPDPSIVKFAGELAAADAMVLISPEYHGSYTGVLKNALDHYWGEFKRKPIGVVTTGSGRFGGVNASSEMQQLVLSLGAFPMPTKLLVPFVQDAFAEEGACINDRVGQDSLTFVEEFVWFSRAIVAAKKSESIL